MKFVVTAAGHDRFGLRHVAEDFLNDICLPQYLKPEEAAGLVMEYFRRAMLGALEELEVHIEPTADEAVGAGLRRRETYEDQE